MNEWIPSDRHFIPEQVFVAWVKYDEEEAAKCCVSWTTEEVKQSSKMFYA